LLKSWNSKDAPTLDSEREVFWMALALVDNEVVGALKAAAEPARRDRIASFMVESFVRYRRGKSFYVSLSISG